MPMDHSADLMQSLVAKLYSILTGDDDSITIPRNKYVSWFLPGVPFSPADFRYCARGFVGETAEEINEIYHEAFVLSKLFDYVPDVSTQFVTDAMQQTLYAGTEDTISSVYRDVLKYSRVVHRELSDKEKEKLQKFRNLLTETVEEEDILTNEKKTRTVPGRLTVAYTEWMNKYIEVADEYMNMKIDAMAASGDDPESKRRVYNFTNKARFMRHKLNSAEMAWTAQGYKNEYEVINAYIEQVTEKSLVLYKQDLKRKLDLGIRSSASDGDFYYTTILPGNFATSGAWTRFTFNEQDAEAHRRGKTSKWGGGGGLNLGLFSIGAKASGSKVQQSQDQKLENFGAEFSFTQVPICRPWFEPGFFSMRSWTLDKNWDLTWEKKVSDGEQQPTGRLVAYPVSALFVRDVKMTSSSFSRHADFMMRSTQGGGSVGYGPFRVGGSHSRGSQERNSSYSLDRDTLSIDGMQLIGFINHVVPKCPNPNPELKPEDFVGGADD